MLKKFLFNAHWLLGITVGVVLAVVGATGAMLSFEHELLLAMNRGVMSVAPGERPRLNPSELVARVREQHPGKRIASFTIWAEPERAARIVFAGTGAARRGDTHYADPYSGRILADPYGVGFFRQVREIHRWLAAGDIGKQIVGASTLALVVLCLTGLYLRWPRNPRDWRAWLALDFTRKGRAFLLALHKVTGTWVLLPYLLMGVTGLYWSYDWYRDALFAVTGAPRPVRSGSAGKAPAGKTNAVVTTHAREPDLAALWTTFVREAGVFRSAIVRLPARPKQPVEINYLGAHPAHDRAYDRLALDQQSGAVIRHERYADKKAGAKLMSSMFALHSGSFFGVAGTIALMLASVLMPVFAITGWMLYLGRKRRVPAQARAGAPA